jgi:CysZ protein
MISKIVGGFGLFNGASYPFRALGIFLTNPRLITYLIIPIIINCFLAIFIYSGLIIFGQKQIPLVINILDMKVDQLIANLPNWLGFLDELVIVLGFFLAIVLIIILFLLTGFILLQFGTILGAPWYGKLSEKLEEFRLNKLEVIEVGLIQDIWRAILFEIKKIILAIIVGIPLLILNFIPGIGTILATIGGLSLTVTIVCLDFLDAPLERRRLKFREKLGIIWQGLPGSGSFGLVCLGLISIPLLNLVTIPICVASGTLFFCDLIDDKSSLSQAGSL